MRNKLLHLPIFHHSGSGGERKVSWLELFYDLMYVASFIQLGNTFSENISLSVFLKTCLVFISLWTSWSGFTYFTNRYNVDDFLHRILVFAHMFFIASLTVLIPSVISGDVVLFSLLFACSQFIISLLYFRVFIQNKFGADYTKYWLRVFFISGLIWALAPLFPPIFIPYVWILGILVVVVSPFLRKARELACEIPFDQEHLSERYGLLTIIVLGESFVKVLSELVGLSSGPNLIMQACFALLLACSIWWIYFDDVADSELKDNEMSMPIWFLAHIPLQLGLVFMGVGIKKSVVFDFSHILTNKYAYILSFSIAAILFCVAMIDLVTQRKNCDVKNNTRVVIRLVSSIFCVLVGLTSSNYSNFVFLTLLLILVSVQILVDLVFSPYSDEDLEQAEVEAQKARERKRPGNEKLIRKGIPNDFKNDLYYTFINSSWYTLLSAIFFYFILSNLFFGLLFLVANGSSAEHSMNFQEAFFFSVQTMSTIGYGVLSPHGLWANIIVTLEAAYGLISVAIITGIVLHKISKPNAKILFSSHLLLSKFDGQRCLSFRLGNVRGNDLMEANLSVSILKDEVTKEGRRFRKIHDLKLKRSHTPFFKQTWHVFHPIDEESPLFKESSDDLQEFNRMIVTLTGHDGVFSNTIYSRYTYWMEDLITDKYFVDIVEETPDGTTVIDYENFHELS